MKRDIDLVRKIALALEARSTGSDGAVPQIDGYTPDQINYHAHLMLQARLATGEVSSTLGGDVPEVTLTGLTWVGHDFIEKARNETRWKKAVAFVQEKELGLTVATVNDVLTALVKKETASLLS